jgi:beta-galactosidase/beta-glucuronidase
MYRKEYPRPQFERKEWLNLNGAWSFAFDDNDQGLVEEWQQPDHHLPLTIEVPFAYQTEKSGIHDPAFHDIVWYKRKIELPENYLGKQLLLHFGAVDYRCQVFIDGQLVGGHEGGETPFAIDITRYTKGAECCLALRVEDPSQDETIPRGKQFWRENSDTIWYTRTTGIWQTVWIEPLDTSHIEEVKYHTNVQEAKVTMELLVTPQALGKYLTISIDFQGKQLVDEQILLTETHFDRGFSLYKNNIFAHNFHGSRYGWSWTPENPNLFDVTLKITDEKTIDQVESYFGLRDVHTENGMVYLNNQPYYQKLVLDQGYWRDGLLTAPDDDAFKQDILLAKEMGFNGCRKHQKVEDPRFLYWADRLGFLVWGECASAPSFDKKAIQRLTQEWFEIINRDYNHPSIITWVPLNESWGVPDIRNNKQQQAHSLALYHTIHSLDTSRLVISNDGWELTETDICAIHNYAHGEADEQEKYQQFQADIGTKEGLLRSMSAKRFIYANGFSHQDTPILLTEFGGIGFEVGKDEGWGYSSAATEEEYLADYRRVMEAVYASKALHGYCYTQLTDVEQEINGLLTYDRQPKCSLAALKEINDLADQPTVN